MIIPWTVFVVLALTVTSGATNAQSVFGDHDGDGKADLLWRHTSSGQNWMYLMNGASISSSTAVNTVSNLDWEIVGTGDFNGDLKADILWRNYQTGQNWLYLMNGATITSSISINSVPTVWKVVGNADFNGDGRADILWRHSTGQVWMYLMNGATITSSLSVTTVPNLDWRIVAAADFDNDGKSDILWRNLATGQNWLYLMSGNAIVDSVAINTVPDLDWQIVGSGDYNGDGSADIFWRNRSTGQNWMYLMNGVTILSSVGVNTVVDTNWQVVGNGDYNGDGKSDALWRNPVTGQNWLYLMNGATIMSSVSVNTVPGVWQVISTAVNLPVSPALTSINLSKTALTLDRWGDSGSVTAQPVDQNGNDINGATITWSSADDTIADVDNAGNITTWLGGTVELTVEATLDGTTVSDSVSVTVAIQQNNNCTVPTEFPVQGPVNPPVLWDVRRVATHFQLDDPEAAWYRGWQISLDVDRDNDYDLVSMVHTPNGEGLVDVQVANRIWLNDGAGNFTDGTDAILGGNIIPWNMPRVINYADIDLDGFEEAIVFQHGWERSCGGVPCEGGFAGGPQLILSPQPGGLVDVAPTSLSPYLDGYTHSGAVADVDCDGDIDIFEANSPTPDTNTDEHLQINSGGGTFLAENARLPIAFSATQSSAQGSTFCDLDRDGDPDLLFSFSDHGEYWNEGNGVLAVGVNDGFGFFRMIVPPGFPSNGLYWDFACGDLDLDGYDDIVIAGDQANPNNGATEIFRNLGNMSFENVSASLLPPNAVGLTTTGFPIVDLNDDGWPEIMPFDLIQNPGGATGIYWNTGGGVFSHVEMFSFCCGSTLTVRDFDGDGRKDIYHNLSHETITKSHLYLNRPPPPIKLAFATSALYAGDLGGLAGADAKCQQHAEDAGLPGAYVAYLSDSTTDALERLSHGEYHRTGDNVLVASSKMEFLDAFSIGAPIQNDEYGATITSEELVRTGTDHFAFKRQATGVAFCSDWTRATDEDPALATSGSVWEQSYQWVWAVDRPCSEPQRLYCFQQ